MTNDVGMTVDALTYGGVLLTVEVPDRRGDVRNVVLGLPTLADYVERSPYFGAVVGRFANRIADGTFAIDGTTYQVPVNDPPTSVHGGREGFDKKVWHASPVAEEAWVGVRLGYVSPDGEEGYPGALDTEVTYRLARDRATLRVDYRATTDRPTVVNLTNHTFFNLAGEGSGSVLDHVVQIAASRYLPLTDTLLPTGELAAVAGTPLDFRAPRTIGERIRSGFDQLVLARGYDHNFVLDRESVADGELAFAVRVTEPRCGRVLEVWTTEPGVDFYTGNFLDGSLVGPSGGTYRQGGRAGDRAGALLELAQRGAVPEHGPAPGAAVRLCDGVPLLRPDLLTCSALHCRGGE
ncbi:galactose mutarotase [Nocardioides panacis]|uniref:Aldose 1-epimerase n=2 Tax=Nocardioides panacis TaxID=2849501 RepID=A0A975T0G4_9ACTN|nr:galactose mutarotase [Nocardioides panacis]